MKYCGGFRLLLYKCSQFFTSPRRNYAASLVATHIKQRQKLRKQTWYGNNASYRVTWRHFVIFCNIIPQWVRILLPGAWGQFYFWLKQPSKWELNLLFQAVRFWILLYLYEVGWASPQQHSSKLHAVTGSLSDITIALGKSKKKIFD
jgi:hypothetical protein